MRITESQLRKIVRQEARRLTNNRPTLPLTEGRKLDRLVNSIASESGDDLLYKLYDACMAKDPSGLSTLEELIDDHTDGEMNASDPKVRTKVLMAIEKGLGIGY